MSQSGPETTAAIESSADEVVPEAIRGRSPRELALIRFRRDKGSMISLGVVLLFLFVAVISPVLTKLKVYKGDKHDHSAQQPKELKLA